MQNNKTTDMAPSDVELVITRVFGAPRSLVFECWTKAEHLAHWQGAPRGFSVTVEKKDVRPGGRFRILMHSPDGKDHRLQGVYREGVYPERLVFTHTWLDANGTTGPETLVTIVFAERNGNTELTLRQTGFDAVESRDGHQAGWASALDRLSEYLSQK